MSPPGAVTRAARGGGGSPAQAGFVGGVMGAGRGGSTELDVLDLLLSPSSSDGED